MESLITETDAALVQQSYTTIAPDAVAFGEAFYDNLFQEVPKAADLFPPQNPHQTVKLMLFLETGINNLQHVEKVAPLLRDLGARHVDYGVIDAHYDFAEKALLTTLQQRANVKAGTDLEKAWQNAYRALTFHMRDAARTEEEKRSKGLIGFFKYRLFKSR